MQPPENWNSRNDVVFIPAGNVTLIGDLNIPEKAQGIVFIIHEGTDSRRSLRNKFIAERLRQEKVGSLLVDLLTPQEANLDDEIRALRFGLPLLASRIGGVTDWLSRHPATIQLRIGYFAIGISLAAAFAAASTRPATVRAIVSYGGRPDLAGNALPQVRAPVLLIAGSLDTAAIASNRQAYDVLITEKRFDIVPGAGPYFEETGKLEEVATRANWWFERFIALY